MIFVLFQFNKLYDIMKNKRSLVLTVVSLFFASIIFAQENGTNLDYKNTNSKDTISFEKAKKSIYDGKWVFEVTKISLNGKNSASVEGPTHFILNKSDSCYVLLYTLLFEGPGEVSGSNGYDICKCKSESISVKEGKKGKIFQEMKLNGINLKAEVYITLVGNDNIAYADIYKIDARKSYKVHYTGRVIPLPDSEYAELSW